MCMGKSAVPLHRTLHTVRCVVKDLATPPQTHSQTQNQPPSISSQTTTNTNRQSSTTSTTSLSSLNGTQTQTTSRTEEKVVAVNSSASVASRSEALSFLDTIRSSSRSQANGTVTPFRSRSERVSWRRDGSRTPGTSSRGLSPGRRRRIGQGNPNTNQVYQTTQSGTSQYR